MDNIALVDTRATPASLLPRRSRTYVSYIFDSRNWDGFRHRPGDVVISTSYKSGTTWMQNILRQLVFPAEPRPPVSAVSPWLDRRNDDIDATLAAMRELGVDVDAQVARMGDPVPPMFWFRDPTGHTLMVVEA